MQPRKKQRKICTEEFFVLVAIRQDNNSPTPHIIFIPNLAPEKEEIASEDRGFKSRGQQNIFFRKSLLKSTFTIILLQT